MIDALVLAGSLNNGSLQSVSQEKYEALIKIGNDSMLSYVLKALQNSAEIDRIVVIGPEAIKATLPCGISWIEASTTMMENIQRGASAMDRPFLITTSDVPLLTPRDINGFLDLCGDKQRDLYFPLIPRELVEKEYPGCRRTYIHFKEGVFTGGNLFLVNPQVVESCLTVGEELINMRKNPLALARRVGFSLLIKLLLHKLSVQEVQHKASRLLGIQGQAVVCPYPGVGVDVDKPADYVLISRVMGYDIQGTVAATSI